jgi:hypothetical protein
MHTYFARHGGNLDIDEETYDRLWEEAIVALHYPEKANGLAESDSESIEPADCYKEGADPLARLHELARCGGYVCAEYAPKAGCLVVYVPPNSEIRAVNDHCENRPMMHRPWKHDQTT